MKHYLLAAFLTALAACSNSGDSVEMTTDLTPSIPSVTLNTSFATLMNGVRATNGVADLTYDSRVGQAAQNHANDMVVNNYFSVTIPGSDNGSGDLRDIGDRVTDAGYSWVDIEQLIAQGEFSTAEAFAAFGAQTCDAVGTICLTQNGFTNFGIAKAGTGSNQKWVFVMVEPN